MKYEKEFVSLDELKKELVGKLRRYKLPQYRKETMTIHNLRWLAKNIEKKNKDRKDLNEVEELINLLCDLVR